MGGGYSLTHSPCVAMHFMLVYFIDTAGSIPENRLALPSQTELLSVFAI